ncbi:MAG: insulinase family protein [Lachnospiraceae bacterium]|nr:insulinase family protein [Lachnospiraceae bacterium]
MSDWIVPAYDLVEERELKDISSKGYILKHKKSGARLCVIANDDDNKVFSIGFRTPPEDETGVPHIIEHTTLCGSDKFPVKDPFIELAKGSLNTFLNAMTYPEKTLYPIASCNDRDYKNLMDVYLDAVFHPNITRYREIFMQEGWHYELEDEDGPLTINGVVYNEMKGAYSSPDEILETAIMQALFPDNTYSRDSGGNPDHIPELTYEAYLEFYHKYYHPSNSYIYLYGNLDVAERLEWMDREYLSEFDLAQVDSEILPQKPFAQVKYVEKPYPVTEGEDCACSTYLSYSKVVGSVLDEKLYQAFNVLDYVLVSSPGAPVRKALIDAGIGEDVYGSYEDGIFQPVFSIVAKNAKKEDRDRFVKIIEDTLKKLVQEGLNKDALLAGINSTEFRFREADFGQFPKGLLYGLQCMESWLYDDTLPFLHLECLDTLQFLRQQIGTGYFEKLIETCLLSNSHGAVVSVVPQPGLLGLREEALKQKLASYKESLSREQVKALVEQTSKLREYQETPSPEEDLEKIPMLTREDMKKKAEPFTNIPERIGSIPVVRHEVETNGIDYITLMFSCGDISQEMIPYMGMLRSIVGYVNTENYSYADLANAINIHTGGVSAGIGVYPVITGENENSVMFEVRIKVLEQELSQALALSDEMIRTSNLTDTRRIRELIAQVKARLQTNLSSSGHTVAAMRSLAGQSSYAFYQDATLGITYYRSICEMEKRIQQDPQAVTGVFRQLMEQIFGASRLTVSFTGTKEAYDRACPVLTEYLSRLPEGTREGQAAQLTLSRMSEGFMDASQIQYVARSGNFRKHGFTYRGTLKILKMILSYEYLWNNVRVKGGAYGCMNSFLRTGDGYFVSYRDPNLAATNEIYEKIPEYVAGFDADERDMTKYIIGTFGALDTPLTPESRGSRSMAAYLEHLTYEEIQKEREDILAAGPKDIRALSDLVASVLSDGCLCVIGNEQALRSEEKMFDTLQGLTE